MCNCEILEAVGNKIKQEEAELMLFSYCNSSSKTEMLKRRIETLKKRLQEIQPCDYDCEYKKIEEEKSSRLKEFEKRFKKIECKMEEFQLNSEKIKTIVAQVQFNYEAIQRVLLEFENIKKEFN